MPKNREAAKVIRVTKTAGKEKIVISQRLWHRVLTAALTLRYNMEEKMTAVEIILIIIGFACVCISFFVSGKKQDVQGGQAGEQAVASDIWTEKEEQMIRDRVMDLLEEEQAELVDSTEARMNRLCNEKIMAIDEFSKPLLEKIETNHQEVVFMYNLLNEKEKDVKKVIAESATGREDTKEAGEAGSESEKAAQKKEEKRTVNTEQPAPAPEIQTEEEPAQQNEARPAEGIDNVNGDTLQKIQKMHKEGKSILEISRKLNMGQGEVKLVVALYGGRAQ